MQRPRDPALLSASANKVDACASAPEGWQGLIAELADRVEGRPWLRPKEVPRRGQTPATTTEGDPGAHADDAEPESVASAVQAIYAAAVGEGRWNTAAACIARLLDSDAVAVLLTGASLSETVATGIAQRSSGARARLEPVNLPATSLADPPVTRVHALAAWVTVEPSLTIGLLVVRNDIARDFTVAERSLFDVILGHVRRAAVIASRLVLAACDVEARHAAVEALGLGLVVMSGRGKILQQNQTATTILQRQRWLCQRGERIHAVDRARAPELQALFASMRQSVPVSCLMLHAAECDSLCLVAIRFQRTLESHDEMPDAPAFALVLCGVPGRDVVPFLLLGQLFDLSQAETRVFASVADGRGVPETAKHLGIGEATVRTHLLNVFRKTGAQSQNDIVRLAARWTFPLA